MFVAFCNLLVVDMKTDAFITIMLPGNSQVWTYYYYPLKKFKNVNHQRFHNIIVRYRRNFYKIVWHIWGLVQESVRTSMSTEYEKDVLFSHPFLEKKWTNLWKALLNTRFLFTNFYTANCYNFYQIFTLHHDIKKYRFYLLNVKMCCFINNSMCIY